jgi:phage repressor protein C with HTH and peptisase S24 domain
MENWHTRLRAELARRGWTQTELARRVEAKYGASAGLRARVQKYAQGRVKHPRGETLEQIAAVLDMTAIQLRYGRETEGWLEAPIVGHLGIGERWTAVEDEGEPVRYVDLAFPLSRGKVVALRMRGGSMSPVYRDGDLLIGQKLTGADMRDSAVGRDCIMQTAGGERYVKILLRGSAPKSFRLRSYNATTPDIEDVAIDWAAPISLISRA